MSITADKPLCQDFKRVKVSAKALNGQMRELATRAVDVASGLYKVIGWATTLMRDLWRASECASRCALEGVRLSTAIVCMLMTAVALVVAYVIDNVT